MKRSCSADRATSRTPSIQPFNNVLPARARSASLGLDVRCGCQFFGTDSLLPERQALMMLGRPKSKPTSGMSSPKREHIICNVPGAIPRKTIVKSARSFSSVGDHEYEPVMAPPPAVRVTGPTFDRYEPELGDAPRREGSNSSTESRERKERKFLHIPLDDEMVVLPADGEGSEDEALGVEEKEDAPLEDRNMVAPSPGTTTGSRTDLELNTSQVDSSALEDLPLSRSARRQQRLEQQQAEGPGAAARSLQRIRSQAGKLRTKLRSIKRPNITMPERPRFSMPDRPKFNFPERPKFNLPSRPKFNIERPKFNLPERPKFNFPSFSLPRSRRPLRERQQEGSSSLEVPDEQNVHVDTPAPSTPGKRNYFDFRTYPRIFDRKTRQSAPTRTRPRPITPPVMRYGDDDEEEMEVEDDEPVRKPKLPPRRRSSGGQQNAQQQLQQRWVGKFTELEYADAENVRPLPRTNGAAVPFDDEDEDEEMRALERELHAGDTEEEQSESLSAFRDKDFGYAVTLGPARPQPPPMLDADDEEVSLQESERGAAHSSGSSSDRRRAGVLEEIDSDEFFLREKGLSQEDVDVGRYLSSEIREAFRPVADTNALLLENATLNEAELARSYRGTPERATKTRPPRRTRPVKQRVSTPPAPPKPIEQEEQVVEDTQHYFNTFPPNKPTRNRRRQLRQQERKSKEYATATVGRPAFPTAPRRKKRTRSEFVLGDNTSQWSEDLNPEWIKTVESQVVTNEVGVGVMVAMMRSDPVEHEYIIPAAPAAPKRGRKQSRTTQPDEDTRSHVSEPAEVVEPEPVEPGYASVVKPNFVEIEIVDKHPTQEVVVPPCTPPPRRMKAPPRPPFPSIRRRRNPRPLSGSGAPHFFTVPHRRGPPTRPMRNYATLGPSRPPRRHRRASLEDVHDGSRNLQSGAVIQKMKERPLPPPPRPPRRERGADEDDSGILTKEEEQLISDVLANEALTSSAAPEDVKYDDIPESENVVQHTLKLSPSSEFIHTQQNIPQDESCSAREIPHFEITGPPDDGPSSYNEELDREPEPVTEAIVQEESTDTSVTIAEVTIPESENQLQEEKLEESLHVEVAPEVTEICEVIQEPVIEERTVETEIMLGSSDIGAEGTADETFMPVEEVSVSTQTDPLPEEELLRLEMEQEEAMCSPPEIVTLPSSEPPSAPEPAASVQPEMSPATAAILQALQAGQLRLELLDVARLNVNELQAQRLLVTDIDGTSLNVNDLQSQGGALVLSTIDAPMSSLAEAIVTAAQQFAPPPPPIQPVPEPVPSTSTSTQCDPPPEPIPQQITYSSESQHSSSSADSAEPQTLTVAPLPETHEPMLVSEHFSPASSSAPEIHSIPVSSPPAEIQSSQPDSSTVATRPNTVPASFYQSLSPVFTTEQVVALQAAAMSNAAAVREASLPPPQPPRRSSTQDLWQPALQQQPPRYQEVEPGIIELGTRLARACYTATLDALRRVVTYTEQRISSDADDTRQRGSLQVALCIVLVLVAGIILIGIGGSGGEVHHHHWDFYMPK